MILYFYVLYQDLITRVPPMMTSVSLGNNMHLTVDNETYLFEWCDPESPPKIKYYVYKMTYSSFMKKK
jgi:hypothetical protein